MNSILLSVLIVLVVIQSSMSWYVKMVDRKTVPGTRLSSILRPATASIYTNAGSPYCTASPCDSSNVFPSLRDFFKDIEDSIQQSKSVHRSLPIDVKETDEIYEIVADVPGVSRDDVKVTVHEGVLTITSERKSSEKHDSEKIRREERYTGTSQRSMTLPEDSDENNITAKYEHGVLYLQIPKLPPTLESQPRTIEIQ